ncbi:MAG: hypothetical protein ACFFDW_08425 [Candidatus Thorarchaeota archaeon]
MESRLTDVINLFKSHKYIECFSTITEIEKEENLTPEIKKKIIDFKIKSMVMLRQYTDAQAYVDKEITKCKNPKIGIIFWNLLFIKLISFLMRKKKKMLC